MLTLLKATGAMVWAAAVGPPPRPAHQIMAFMLNKTTVCQFLHSPPVGVAAGLHGAACIHLVTCDLAAPCRAQKCSTPGIRTIAFWCAGHHECQVCRATRHAGSGG